MVMKKSKTPNQAGGNNWYMPDTEGNYMNSIPYIL